MDHKIPAFYTEHYLMMMEQIRKHEIAVATLDHSECSPFLNETFTQLEMAKNIFCLVLVLKGEATVQIDFEQFTFRQHDVIVGLPDATKNVKHIENNAVVRFVAFSAELPAKLDFPDYFLDHAQYYFSSSFKPQWSLSAKEAKHLDDLITNLAFYLEHQENRSFGNKLLINMFQVFIYELVSLATSYAERLPQQSSRKKQLFLLFYRLVKKEFRQHRDVGYYADRLSISPKYLSEIVKETADTTALRIIEQFVVSEAKTLLGIPSLTVSEVADRLNFPEQSAFGKYFRRSEGVSPKAFRERLQGHVFSSNHER